MEFRRGINLLIGDNAAGKTSLLRACNLVMNSFFSGFSDENTKVESIKNFDFRAIVDGQSKKEDKPVNISFSLSDLDLYSILLENGRIENFRFDKTLQIAKKSKKNTRYLTSGLKELNSYTKLLKQHIFSEDTKSVQQKNSLPVYACFTTEDIHSKRKIEKIRYKEYIAKPSFGYYQCADCRGLLDYWFYRLMILQEGFEEENIEIANVRNAIKSALGAEGCNIISDILIRPVRKSIYFKFMDGRIVESSLLSDGYRRLVNIVVDIAIRCALLNKGIYGTEAYKETHGTVIIDEIDEHLHPELQVRILKALHDTFPKIQFIVSTHAPLVMSSVETSPENVVYKLEYKDGEYSHRILNTYGLDASTIMEVYMGNNSRDLGATADFAKLFETIDKEDYVSARTMLESLKERYCDDVNPELVRAEAMLSFLEE